MSDVDPALDKAGASSEEPTSAPLSWGRTLGAPASLLLWGTAELWPHPEH